MIDRDTFVGVVSVGAGLFVLASALFGQDRLLEARVPALLARQLGEFATRCFLIATGLLFVAIGVYLLRPWADSATGSDRGAGAAGVTLHQGLRLARPALGSLSG